MTQRAVRERRWLVEAISVQTPLLFHHFNWKNLSLIAGLSRWTLHFEVFAGTVKSPQVVIFLERLLCIIPGKVLIVWDGLAAHRSRLVKNFLASLEERIHTLRLPAYAPELNPVEYIWAHLKQHELCPTSAPKICGASVPWPAIGSSACAAESLSCLPAGNSLRSAFDHATLCEPQ